MNLPNQLLSPESMRMIALTLLQFLWQGAALAALAYAGMAFCRSAGWRYAMGVAALVLMAVAPAVTLLTLTQQERGGTSAVSSNVRAVDLQAAKTVAPDGFAERTSIPVSHGVPSYFFWMVELWFVGVMLFSLRSAGGVLVVEQLRRKESRRVSGELLQLCLALKEKMGLQRMVSFCECVRMEAPAVVGWLRPVVLLPASALTGLSEAQLSSVIAHELAHIKRFDPFVNLFQIAVETLLFYHPAVWWLSKRIRDERENCCDDMAVAVCGSPLTHAHALARLAESTASPRFILAANNRPLAARVARLLGVKNAGAAIRRVDLSMGLLCLSASLVAGIGFMGVARSVHAQTHGLRADLASQAGKAIPSSLANPAQVAQPSPKPNPAPSANTLAVSEPTPVPIPSPSSTLEALPFSGATPMPAPVPTPQTASGTGPSSTGSYIDGLKAAGLNDLTVDQIIGLKVQGVTPEYVRSMRDLGLAVDPDELIGMKVQGITPEYVRELRQATGESLDSGELIGMKVQGITPEYVKQMQDLGLKADGGELIGLKVQGVTPEYVREMRKIDTNVDAGELIGLKVQGVTPEYVKEIQALGLHPDAGELVGMKVQGIDAAYLKNMQTAGFKLDVDDAIGAKVQGVTPEFIAKVRSHGFKDLTMQQLIALKSSGALDDTK